MIQIFEVTAPLGERDPDASVDKLTSAAAKVRHSFPPLLDADVTAAEGVLTLRLRVSGRDRWDLSSKARKIASSMLWRLKIPAEQGTMDLVRTEPSGNTLTKAQGRSVTNHRARGKTRVDSAVTPEDPS